MAQRVDVLACKPDELFLAVSQKEQQQARESVKELKGRKNIPIRAFSTMSEHIIPTTNYGWSYSNYQLRKAF